MSRDAEKKRALLAAWWAKLLADNSCRLFEPLEPLDSKVAMARLASLPVAPSVYLLLADIDGDLTPVYIGKADRSNPSTRWQQHLDGWVRGTSSYARWRNALLDEAGRVRYALTLLVVPADAIENPPLPGFPRTIGSVEYQLVGLAADAFPGRLLNSEGQGR